MEKFTIKDFIEHNNPCFICGSISKIEFFRCQTNYNFIGLKANIVGQNIEINISTSYYNAINLLINPKHNTWISNDIRLFEQYISLNNIIVTLECTKCKSLLKSNELIFSHDKRMILPLTIINEMLFFEENNKSYHIATNDTSRIFIYNTLALNDKKKIAIPFEIEVPKITLDKIKNKGKDWLINKLNGYVVFS